jgi:hypothetical protein
MQKISMHERMALASEALLNSWVAISAERNNLWFPGERAMTIKPGAPRRYMMAALRRKACCP